MKKMIYVLPALILSLSATYAPLSFAGMTRPCTMIEVQAVKKAQLVLKSCRAALELTATKGILQCELGTYEAVIVTHRILGDSAAVPKGGYLKGRFVTYDGNGNVLEDRNHNDAYFLVNSYPFAGDIQKLHIEIEEFGTADIDLN